MFLSPLLVQLPALHLRLAADQLSTLVANVCIVAQLADGAAHVPLALVVPPHDLAPTGHRLRVVRHQLEQRVVHRRRQLRHVVLRHSQERALAFASHRHLRADEVLLVAVARLLLTFHPKTHGRLRLRRSLGCQRTHVDRLLTALPQQRPHCRADVRLPRHGNDRLRRQVALGGRLALVFVQKGFFFRLFLWVRKRDRSCPCVSPPPSSARSTTDACVASAPSSACVFNHFLTSLAPLPRSSSQTVLEGRYA